MSADVVEGLDFAGFGLDQEEVPAHKAVGKVVACFFEALLVGDKKPGPCKNGFFFVIEYFL
ncbi:UNVERIFIED_CONTAM: hypothetical protein ACS92_04645 [Bacillus cereus]